MQTVWPIGLIEHLGSMKILCMNDLLIPIQDEEDEKKKAPVLRASILSECQAKLRGLKQRNLPPFQRQIRHASSQQISTWLSTNSPVSFRPTAQMLDDFESAGFCLEAIMDLVLRETPKLKDNLGLNEGEWSGLLQLCDSVLRGEVSWNMNNNNNNN
eukprot:126623_1